MSVGLEQYFSAVKRFNDSVSDLVAKLDQVNNARAEALRASEEIRAELDSTDKQLQEIAAMVRQQISPLESLKKAPQSEEAFPAPPLRRVG